MHVVAAHHGAQQLGSLGLGDESHLDVTVGHGCQEAGLDLGGIVHARRNAVREQVERSEEHTSELQSQSNLVCRLLLEKKKRKPAKGRAEPVSFQATWVTSGFLKLPPRIIRRRRTRLVA